MRRSKVVLIAVFAALGVELWMQSFAFGQTVAVTADGANASTLFAPLVAGIGTVVSTLLLFLINRGIAAFEARTGIQLADNQKDIMRGAALTGTGLLQMELTKGTMVLDQMHVSDPRVISVANAVMTGVPVAAGALGITPNMFAQMVVAGLGKALGQDPTVPGVMPVPSIPVVTPSPAPKGGKA